MLLNSFNCLENVLKNLKNFMKKKISKILQNKSISSKKIQCCQKNSMLSKNFNFVKKFPFCQKSSILSKNFNFMMRYAKTYISKSVTHITCLISRVLIFSCHLQIKLDSINWTMISPTAWSRGHWSDKITFPFK